MIHCTYIIPPSNIAVVSGNSPTFQCASSLGSSAIYWFTGLGTYVVINCAVQAGFTTQYTVDNSTVGHCDLIILNATPASALTYNCQDEIGSFSAAFLTVLGKD